MIGVRGLRLGAVVRTVVDGRENVGFVSGLI